jgi:carbon monoxide dehydrogenase subunit G
MKISGEEVIPASVQSVWNALNDPQVLKQCIPGCESITRTGDNAFSARVVAKVGPVKAGFNGSVQLKDLNPPHSYRIEGKGEGGLAGFASGGANVRLEAVPEGTKLLYDVDAQIGGKLAMLGARLIDSTAQSMAGQFFDKLAKLAASAKPAPAAAKVRKPAKKKAAKKLVKKAAKKPAKKPKKSAKKAAKKPAKKAMKAAKKAKKKHK